MGGATSNSISFLISTTALVIPKGLRDNMKSAIPLEQLSSDADKFNDGYAYFIRNVHLEEGKIIRRGNPTYIYKKEYEPYRDNHRSVKVNREIALLEIKNFISTYNKYTDDDLAYPLFKCLT